MTVGPEGIKRTVARVPLAVRPCVSFLAFFDAAIDVHLGHGKGERGHDLPGSHEKLLRCHLRAVLWFTAISTPLCDDLLEVTHDTLSRREVPELNVEPDETVLSRDDHDGPWGEI